MSFERNERLYANFFVQQTLFIGNYITEMTRDRCERPTVPLAHVLRLFTRSLKLAYRRDYALTRANVEDVWMPRKTFANLIYIYDFRFLNFIYRGSRAKLCYWIKVPSRVAALLKRIEFLQRVFLREVLPLGMSSKLRRGYTGFESLLRAKVELEFISSRSYR